MERNKPNTNIQEVHILTEAELAAYLHLPRWTIRSLRLQQGLPYFRTARRVFYCLEDVITWIHQEGERNRQILPDNEQRLFPLG